MAKTDINTIKNWFKTGLKPTQVQFWATWDSFWHKDEKLPITSIEGLGNAIDGKANANHSHTEYALNNASSLSLQDVDSWKQVLGVADLEFDDNAITITQSYPEFGLVAGDKIKFLNAAIYAEVFKKLDAPTDNNTNQFVLLADGSTAPKTDFGKVDTVMGVQANANKNVDISGVAMNWTNSSQRFSGILDKSADATYNTLVAVDNNGNLGKVSKLYNVLKSTLTDMTQEQSLEIGQLLNGGQGSSGIMSVNSIVPPVLGNNDEIFYVLLKGSNLYLKNDDYSVSLISENGTEYKVPSSQVQLNSDGLSLIFYFNYSQVPLGTYNIKLVSGVKVVTTTLTMQVVNGAVIDNVDVSNLNWEILTSTESDYERPYILANGNNVSIHRATGSAAVVKQNVVTSIKSQAIFFAGENFVLELSVSFETSFNFPNRLLGIGYDTNMELVNQTLNYIRLQGWWNGNHGCDLYNQNTRVATYFSGGTITTSIIFIKKDNLLTTIIEGNIYSQIISNNSNYSIYLNCGQSSTSGKIMEASILKAYKF